MERCTGQGLGRWHCGPSMPSPGMSSSLHGDVFTKPEVTQTSVFKSFYRAQSSPTYVPPTSLYYPKVGKQG